jgi:hypothetical protein
MAFDAPECARQRRVARAARDRAQELTKSWMDEGRTMRRTPGSAGLAPLTAVMTAALAAACAPDAARSPASAPDASSAAVSAAEALPEVVNGWREYPLRAGVISLHDTAWKSEVIDIRVPRSGGDLEYKLDMKAGDTIVYTISYGDISHPGLMVSEFHGHTPKGPDGVGDLMFYSKTGGSTEHGAFTAPWSGIHGWYLKNDSEADIVVRLELAGYYARTDE